MSGWDVAWVFVAMLVAAPILNAMLDSPSKKKSDKDKRIADLETQLTASRRFSEKMFNQNKDLREYIEQRLGMRPLWDVSHVETMLHNERTLPKREKFFLGNAVITCEDWDEN